MKQKRNRKPNLPAIWKQELKKTARMKLGGKTYTFQPLRVGLVLVAALLVLVVLVNLLLIPARRPRAVDMGFEAGGDYTILPYRSHALMYNRQQLREVTPSGKTVWEEEISMSHPIAEVAEDYILLADLSGNNLSKLYKRNHAVHEFTHGDDIISADVNPKGMTAFATATIGYKGKVIVYDKKGKEKFSWNSGEGYILDIALSDNGKYLAVAQLSGEGTQADSKIQMIDLNRKKVVATAQREGSVISEIRFSDNRVLSVSNTEFCGFKTNGKLAFSVFLGGRNPGKYDISGDKLLAFATTDNRGNAMLELYNTKGKQKGAYRSEHAINHLAVFDDMAVITGQRDILCVNRRGKLKKSIPVEFDIKSLGLFGDGKTVLGAGNTLAFLAGIR